MQTWEPSARSSEPRFKGAERANGCRRPNGPEEPRAGRNTDASYGVCFGKGPSFAGNGRPDPRIVHQRLARSGRHRRRDRAPCPTQEIRPQPQGPVPVPRREDAVVQRQRGPSVLPLFRLRSARYGHRVPDGIRQPDLPGSHRDVGVHGGHGGSPRGCTRAQGGYRTLRRARGCGSAVPTAAGATTVSASESCFPSATPAAG